MNAPQSITTLRAQLAARRMVRQRSRRLEAELASYTSPSERLELDSILSRHTDEEIQELEKLVSRTATWLPTQR